MSCIVHSAVCLGMNIHPVSVEAALGSGFSGLQLIGVPQDYARDARERIRAALEALGMPLPARRLVVAFRPTDVLKQFHNGLEHLDLPCAIAIVAALSDQSSNDKKQNNIPEKVARALRSGRHHLFAGQLTLAGAVLRPAQSLPFEMLILENAHPDSRFWSAFTHNDIQSAPRKSCVTVGSLGECLRTLIQDPIRTHADLQVRENVQADHSSHSEHTQLNRDARILAVQNIFDAFIHVPCLALALAVAAAGRHHILLAGSPGCGKTFALRRLHELLPVLQTQEKLEVALIHQRNPNDFERRPFRTPHHSASAAALLGGSLLQPGEVSLAHHGLLFLDELTEFPRPALEALREPLDEKKITLSRSRGRVELPADFMLSAATNPCACGFFFSRHRSCRCVGNAALKYQQKLSGPLLERFNILLLIDSLTEAHPHSDTDTTERTALLQLALQWQDTYRQNPAAWCDFFLNIQDSLWTPAAESSPSSHQLRIMDTLKSRCEQQRLSPRVQNKLSQLAVTTMQLFPDAVQNWEFAYFCEAIQQMRGLEAALQNGAAFLTPLSTLGHLKDSSPFNDTQPSARTQDPQWPEGGVIHGKNNSGG